MNKFTIDYDNQVLTLEYKAQFFMWSLIDGDVGDFWHSFVTNDKKVLDIQFGQEDESCEPSLSVYPCIKNHNGKYETDTSTHESIPCLVTLGDAKNYFR